MSNPLAGDVDVPALGSVPKKVLIPVVVAAAGFVAWRFYVARQTAGDGEAEPIVDGEFGAVDTSIPGVIGAVKDGNLYGEPQGDKGSDAAGGAPTTNDEWARRATEQLQSSDRYSYADIVEALGNYLGGQPLSSSQQQIVRAAQAVQGRPPVGNPTIVPGGDAALAVAPGGLRVLSSVSDAVTFSWSPVPGAARYRIIRGGAGYVGDTTTTQFTAKGLKPNSPYIVTVTPVTAAGKEGPVSNQLHIRTTAVKLTAPRIPTAVSVGPTSARLETGAVPGATSYRWYLDGKFHGTSEAAGMSFYGFAKNSTHYVSVSADTVGQNEGPRSPARKFTTKKK